MRRIPVLLLAAALLPTAVQAQSNCAEREKVVHNLENGYGEAFAGGGLRNAQQIFEVWFSQDKGTWTILLTRADGVSCIMATGTNWREADMAVAPVVGIPG